MAELFKEKFNPAFFDQFVQIVQASYRPFDIQTFRQLIYDENWQQREMKERIRHISTVLGQLLPPKYESALDVLMEIAPDCSGFEYLFFPDFVEVYGLDNWQESIIALEQFTEYSSSEFAVRPFILNNQEKMMDQMFTWSKHNNHHVRRLATEGCGPRLPWAMSLPPLKKDPAPILPILEQLKQDSSLYVRKSVANNLNDISKDHPAIVKQIVKEWQGNNAETDWIVKHGSRSMLKSGDAEALSLFGKPMVRHHAKSFNYLRETTLEGSHM